MILRSVSERPRDELEEIIGEKLAKLGDGNVSDFQKKKASGKVANDFPTIDERDETHQMIVEIDPLLIALGYRTWMNILLTHGEHPCHCLEQTF